MIDKDQIIKAQQEKLNALNSYKRNYINYPCLDCLL
uniref:Uncharacterized protein n=1 Tax=Siphoviridae sp. ctkTc5 TaxID=2827922 RepID=A0A8S5SL70_9CAUD|nr:MAG TPA: hypothetical protein [Siphoviridae sp. ctkTc5]